MDDRLLDQLKALGDETRMKAFKLVQSQELCVCHVVAALRLAQPTVSAHLAKLKRAGLVKVRREGQWSHYSVDQDGLRRFRHSLDDLLSRDLSAVPEWADLLIRLEETRTGARPCGSNTSGEE